MIFADLPPQLESRAVCAIEAAVRYEIPANVVLAVAEQEGGHPDQWVLNANGTYDVGSMQFNTSYLRDLAQYGITPKDVAAAGCYSFDLAAWRLRQHLLHDPGDMWTRVADYHSRTPAINAVYRRQIMIRAERWAVWLEAHFVTVDVTPGGKRALRQPAVAMSLPTRVVLNEHQASPAVTSPRAYVPRAIVAVEDNNGK